MKTQDVKNLSEIIHDKLNIDFESFVNGINDEAKFNDFRNRLLILENKKRSALNETPKPQEIAVKIEEPFVDHKKYDKSFEEKDQTPKNKNQSTQSNQPVQTQQNQILGKQNESQQTQKPKPLVNPVDINKQNISEPNDTNELILSLYPKNEEDL